ncbi:ABC transporter permease [Patescibacteria group bacterium]|nr:ABC transporter permease [Patescibacteria group bacterium]
MDISELFYSALEALTLNKLRTALAGLGIVIGIGAVIALISLGEASQLAVQNQIQSLGSNLLTVIPGSQRAGGGVQSGFGGATTLTYDDAKAIATSPQITTVAQVSPELSRRAQVTTGAANTNTSIMGATPAYETVHNLTLQSGSFITSDQVDSLSKVAVIGPTTASNLFGDGTDPVGQNVRINKVAFRIIGETASKGGTGFNNQDDMIIIPLTTAQKLVFGVDYVSDISLQAKNANDMTAAQNEVGYFLLSRHHFNDPSQADFSIFSQADILGAASQITGTFTVLLSGIAAISLLVGGIGIMNIMLVTVIERTREIGLRKALGATSTVIITQFLIEAIFLTFGGGVIGAGLGIGLSFVASKLISLPFTVSLSAILLSFSVSAAIGIIFGWYPAQKAAKLSPIEALRYE